MKYGLRQPESMKELALHILDLVQNSITAGATHITADVREDIPNNLYVIRVHDNGCGMSEELVKRVTDPYVTSRTTRRVGMGIPLLMHSAGQAGGRLSITSKPGEGTFIEAVFEHDHIDRPELGDIAGVMTILIGGNPDIRFQYKHQKNEQSFVLDTDEIRETLEGIPINEPEVLKFIREMIREHISVLT
ncbi:MAG: ATP-binding protein [Bacteroidales bacterium]|nr:ATP-binding protein [Bacteroidales bacterium]